jgi:hypothetical protein
MLFNDLLADAGISPLDVRLIRHHTNPGIGGQSLHDLWCRDRAGFERYQRVQHPQYRLFRSGSVWAAFTSPEPGVTTFIGLYDARYLATQIVDEPCPYRGDQPGGGAPMDVFETRLRPELAEHVGSLRIEWDASSIRTWARYADNAPFAILPVSASIEVPPLVASAEELEANLGALEALRSDSTAPDHATYLGFVKRGTCFVPYQTPEGLAFAPSRLIGYRDNDFARHLANDQKHGSHTNGAISAILGREPAPSERMEQAYLTFCRSLGVVPNTSGTFGHPRKYWASFDASNRAIPRPNAAAALRFELGALMTRAEIADVIGLAEGSRGGPWLTGYAKVAGEFFLFANVGSSGRTGHNYPNRWEDRDFIWHGKSSTRRGQPEIEEMLEGKHPVHIFWRSYDRAAFTYAGCGSPIETMGEKPVQVRWRFLEDVEVKTAAADGPMWRRGPPPVAGTRVIEYADGPTSVYLLQLEGPIAAAFPDLLPDRTIVKIGMSNEPARRLGDLSCGFPPGCALRWRLAAHRQLPDGDAAFALETSILEDLRLSGDWIGGEFASVSVDTLRNLHALLEDRTSMGSKAGDRRVLGFK